MQLIMILLIIVSLLTILSGVAVLSGAHKGERFPAFIFLITTIFASLWCVGCGIFLALPETTDLKLAEYIFRGYYIAAPLMCWGLMTYASYKYRLGKIAIGVFGVICLALIYVLIFHPELHYSGFELNDATGNIVHLRQNLFFTLYGAYHCITVLIYMISLWYTIRHTSGVQRRGHLMVLYGFATTGIIALVFNFLLTYFGKYDTIWIGPAAMCVAWIFHYYAILRYRLLNLSSSWLKSLSYIITMALAAIVYLAIFFIIFTAIFKVSSPSLPIIILNVLMVVAVLLMIPALNELSTYVQSLSSAEDVDVSYIVKKLTSLVGYEVNLTELSNFLADHLHFEYIGLVINGELYGSKTLKLSAEDLAKIEKLKNNNADLWLELPEDLKKALKKADIEAVAELHDSKGKLVGQILVGKPLGRVDFADRDLVPIEIIFNIVPVVTHPGPRRIKKHLL